MTDDTTSWRAVIQGHLDSDKQHLNDLVVELVRVVRDPEPEFDEEALPMAYVRAFNTNEVLLVFPEELDRPLP